MVSQLKLPLLPDCLGSSPCWISAQLPVDVHTEMPCLRCGLCQFVGPEESCSWIQPGLVLTVADIGGEVKYWMEDLPVFLSLFFLYSKTKFQQIFKQLFNIAPIKKKVLEGVCIWFLRHAFLKQWSTHTGSYQETSQTLPGKDLNWMNFHLAVMVYGQLEIREADLIIHWLISSRSTIPVENLFLKPLDSHLSGQDGFFSPLHIYSLISWEFQLKTSTKKNSFPNTGHLTSWKLCPGLTECLLSHTAGWHTQFNLLSLLAACGGHAATQSYPSLLQVICTDVFEFVSRFYWALGHLFERMQDLMPLIFLFFIYLFISISIFSLKLGSISFCLFSWSVLIGC